MPKLIHRPPPRPAGSRRDRCQLSSPSPRPDAESLFVLDLPLAARMTAEIAARLIADPLPSGLMFLAKS